MAIYSGVYPPLRERRALREMQSLSQEMETKCGPVIIHYKGWRAASRISRWLEQSHAPFLRYFTLLFLALSVTEA